MHSHTTLSVSGAKLNVEKSHGLLVGLWRSGTKLPIALNRSSSSITVLGFELVNDVADRSWANHLAKLGTVLATWKTRQLSFHGRALVINSLGLSLFWYLCSFLVMPDQVVTAVNANIFSFLWKKKPERLARVSVTQRTSHGGLGLIDMQRKIQSLHVGSAFGHPSNMSIHLLLSPLFTRRICWPVDSTNPSPT